FFSPTQLGAINDTPLTFGGYDGVALATVFGVAGDLNLHTGDRILGVGSAFLRIVVGKDAMIEPGAKISVEGFAAFPGAGAGAGGRVQVDNALPPEWVTVGGFFSIYYGIGADQPGNTTLRGFDGVTGLRGYVVEDANQRYIYPWPGYAGGT